MRWLALIVLAVPLAAAPPKDGGKFFEERIRPLLAHKCFACHTSSKLGGLRLDSRESMLAGGNSGPAVVPGDPDASLLIRAVSGKHERLKMPLSGALEAAEVEALSTWVKDGAAWPDRAEAAEKPKRETFEITPEQKAFWAFQPIGASSPPAVKRIEWAKGAIDRFVAAKLEEKGLEPVKPAARHALIRRVTFDLTGLPPTPKEVDDFESDRSPDAFAKVVDRLLSSPRYGERWARYWLDLARYADGRLGASNDAPYENAFRYRDWVIEAFNSDMPYDRMVKAQIAADLMEGPGREKLLPGLGFQALGGDAHERLDVTTKTFLGLTVGCAQCHDHKYDPISAKDYYSLYGVFTSTVGDEAALAGAKEVKAYKQAEKRVEEQREILDDFIKERSTELGEILVHDTSRYLMAAWDSLRGAPPEMDGLDPAILGRWVRYLKEPKKDHAFLKPWFELVSLGADKVERERVKQFADEFQALVLSLFAEKREIDDRNYVKLGGAKGAKDERTRQYTNLDSLDILKYYLWRDLASDPFQRNGVYFPGGIYYFGVTDKMRRDFEVRGGEVPDVEDIDRFLSGPWKQHMDRLRATLKSLEKALPPKYPFLHAIKDAEKPENAKVHIRGDEQNLGEEAPRGFLPVLCDGEPERFTKGSGRLELAEAVARHPITARVMANRVWQMHFGHGIVRSPSNFGQLGERPTHPELLEYLAARLVASGWSLKALHREILLSSTYALSANHSAKNYEADPENRLLWRANLQPRLDVEAMRDAMLFVAGSLNLESGGPPTPFDDSNLRRTIYGYIGRTKPDTMLSLFDFPNPNNTSERRNVTLGPLQRLFFMNSAFVARQADSFAERVRRAAGDDEERIRRAYLLAFSRQPTAEEIRMGIDFLRKKEGGWSQYAQVLMTSAEFVAVN